jgi:hypothetical protein
VLQSTNSVHRAWKIEEDLAQLAEAANTILVMQKKQLNDEIKKHQASKPKTGAIILKVKIVGQSALDKAMKAK